MECEHVKWEQKTLCPVGSLCEGIKLSGGYQICVAEDDAQELTVQLNLDIPKVVTD